MTLLCVCEHEGAAAEETEEQKDGVAHQRKEHAVFGHAVGPLAVARAQSARQKRVDADRRARGQADHQVLRRKAEGHRRERLLADHADKDAVHDVVKRLHQHRDHQRHRHVQYEFSDGHDAHFVFRRLFHLCLSSLPVPRTARADGQRPRPSFRAHVRVSIKNILMAFPGTVKNARVGSQILRFPTPVMGGLSAKAARASRVDARADGVSKC